MDSASESVAATPKAVILYSPQQYFPPSSVYLITSHNQLL
ncbi:TPA: hypothetical protein ACOEGY_001443 [Enterobacter bugandensis]|nr:hypothetical protein [Enterobacter cloacae complex sp. P1B]MBE4967644.1 hypothetical protein [Enterobacter cloacae complex sp. P11RS]MBT2088935.1 hypothetical protein [Enterobacter bugandensis]HCM9444624.1 hypothetical protein [Enterobacter bugandensis]